MKMARRWRILGPTMTGAILLGVAGQAKAQDCFSDNPADWPAPARPYFLLAVDTSGSMYSSAAANSCKIANGFPTDYPDTRNGAARCALTKTVRAYAGQVNFGLMMFAFDIRQTGSPPVACPTSMSSVTGCTYSNFPGNSGSSGCGPIDGDLLPGTAPTAHRQRRGGAMLVALQPDQNPPQSPGNFGDILAWADNRCNDCRELPAWSNTPLNGILRDAYRYLARGWNKPPKAATATPYDFPTPLTGNELGCRSVNVILLTDGAEACGEGTSAVDAATQLWAGFDITTAGQTNHWRVRVHVIDAQNATPSTANVNIANAGNGIARGAVSEQALSSALAEIISGAIKPEVCNNEDDDCNGCVDEGYKHYCNRNRTPSTNPTNMTQCCSAARATCMANFQASITTSNPTGNRWWLPCHTPSNLNSHLTDSANWLCYDPGEYCDERDNNCDGNTPNASTIDEDQIKCNGKCPSAEICDGIDNDCNGIIDEASGSSVPYSIPGCVKCVPSAEQCDGCDNDCNGIADDGVDPVSCGFPSPAHCAGQMTCVPKPVSTPGACVTGGVQWGACSNHPQTEICNGIDDNCNGQIDENIPPEACDVPGHSGLVYKSPSHPKTVCERGVKPCMGECTGWVGPSEEICDGLDNDCDGIVDNIDPLSVGKPCDGVCGKGVTACVNGALICQTNVQPQPEVCNGIDDDCDGIVDNGTLLDAPSAAQKPCWALDPSGCSTPCSYTGSSNTVAWCAPPQASCHELGTLVSPCQLGSLACVGGGWVCAGGQTPDAEVCDGVDNDCDGSVDEGLPTVTCGSNVGECKEGVQQCIDGKIECVGAVGPVPEVCDGKDNDCDGEIDNGIAIGTPCWMPYDDVMYPGDRDKGQCKPGVSKCGPNGEIICEGGKGPSPEICDGLDNDCDGKVDELGPPNDGINGTSNPKPGKENEKIGEACGSDVGQCEPGKWTCVDAQFMCVGGVHPQPEICDCLDNDCDGQTDEDPSAGEPALCSDGKACVVYAGGCQCAALCGGGEYPCPTGGFTCEAVNYSHTGESAGNRCVMDGCGDCSSKTVTGPSGIECAPAGTVDTDGTKPPVCVCVQNACHRPCYGVTCTPPSVCTDYGPNAGKCVQDTCWNVPCGGGQVCDDGQCVDNPCKPDSCEAGQVCKPAADFSSFECVGSCAGVKCEEGDRCESGKCVPTGCEKACEAGQVCNGSECVDSKCSQEACDDGSYCDPLTGQCGNWPCEGVVCPSGQDCEEGECVEGGGGSGGSGGSSGSGGASGTGGQGATGGASGTGGTGEPDGGTGGKAKVEPKGNWGLATGGGGCACETGVGVGGKSGLLASLLLGLSAFAWRRRNKGVGVNGEEINAPENGRKGGQR